MGHDYAVDIDTEDKGPRKTRKFIFPFACLGHSLFWSVVEHLDKVWGSDWWQLFVNLRYSLECLRDTSSASNGSLCWDSEVSGEACSCCPSGSDWGVYSLGLDAFVWTLGGMRLQFNLLIVCFISFEAFFFIKVGSFLKEHIFCKSIDCCKKMGKMR